MIETVSEPETPAVFVRHAAPGSRRGEDTTVNLGRYEVVRELGKGAMGVVYLAKDPLIGRLVALKTIRVVPGSDDDDAREFQQRFSREAQAAGILSHPAIVTVHDIGQDETSGISYIAMEYVEGPNLKEILNQGRPLEWHEIAEVLAQVGDALDYAHAKGIVHRDVKPANIILCGEMRAKITDFGIAKIASMAGNLTTTGQFLGTPNYMAPEQIKGSPVDGRTDIFSLGIVLYEALTRRKPFSGESLTTISYKIVHEPYLPVCEINPRIPEGFDDVIRKCLAKEPVDRFQRGKDVAIALRAISRGDAARPAAEPLLFEQTVADTNRVPTMELPFPDAAADSPEEEVATISLSRKPELSKPVKRRFDPRALARTPIAPAIFFGIIVVLIAAVSAASLAIWQQRVPVPKIDAAREAAVARQRALRVDGARLLAAGNIDAAYAKYSELVKLVPKSPAVAQTMAHLEQLRLQQMTQKQRMVEAQAELESGKRLYEARKFAEAIPRFEEAFHLDPDSETAVNYLRMSREQLSLAAMKEPGSSSPSRPQPRTGTATRAAATAPASTSPAALVTVFSSTSTDGYILVKVDGETVLHENLWTERKSGLFRRRAPRELNEYREVAPNESDVQVWVVIPSLKVTEHRVFRKRFGAGAIHRLVVKFDPESKIVEMQLL